MELIRDWQRFSEVLIETNELDPMYDVMKGVYDNWERKKACRFIMAFLLFYDAGTALKIAEATTDRSFWLYLRGCALDSATPRGTERRHFRGQKCLDAVDKLQSFGQDAENTLELMYPWASKSYGGLYAQMTGPFAGTQFGHYFIWKLYDVFNVCMGKPIYLEEADTFKYMPEEPVKVLKDIWPKPGEYKSAFYGINQYVSQFEHPVREGKCGVAETETIVCALKGYLRTGRYKIGYDIGRRHYELKGTELQDFLPPLVHADAYRVVVDIGDWELPRYRHADV